MEEIQYYFTSYEKNEISCPGKAVLLWNEHDYLKAKDVSDIASSLDKLSETEYCETFGSFLQGILSAIQEEEKDTQKTKEPFAVISRLMELDIPDSDKWKLQKIFFDQKGHQGNVLALLEKAALLLQDFSQELEALAEDFCRYWTGQFQDTRPSSYIQEKLHIDVGENPMGLRVCPNFMRPNTGSFYMELDDGGNYKQAGLFRIGIIFGEDFSLQTSREQTDTGYGHYASQVLKLLGDKSKFEILSYIRDKEAYGSELAKHLGLTTATISHHMNALINADLAKIKRIDKRVYYISNKKALGKVLDYSKGLLLGNTQDTR